MPKTDPTIEKTIHALEHEYPKLYNGGRFDRLVTEFYAPDARFLPPNAPIVVGRDALRAFMGEISRVLKDLEILPGPVLASGDLAVTQGRYRVKVHTPEGTVFQDEGKFIEAWRREPDGSWKCFMDAFNSDLETAH